MTPNSELKLPPKGFILYLKFLLRFWSYNNSDACEKKTCGTQGNASLAWRKYYSQTSLNPK